MKLSSLVHLSLAFIIHHTAFSIELRGSHVEKSERNLIWEMPLRDGHDYTTKTRENDGIIKSGPILDHQNGQLTGDDSDGGDEDVGGVKDKDIPIFKFSDDILGLQLDDDDDDASRFLDTVLVKVLELLCEQSPDSVFCSDTDALEALVGMLSDLYCGRNPDSTICLDICGSFPNAPWCTGNGDDQPVDDDAQGLLNTVLDRVLELLCEQIPVSIFCSEDKDGTKILLEKSLLEKALELRCRRNPDSSVICLEVCESFPNIPGCAGNGKVGDEDKSKDDGDVEDKFEDDNGNNDGKGEARPIFNFPDDLPDFPLSDNYAQTSFLDTVLDRVLELLCEQSPDSVFCSDALEALVEMFLDLYCGQNPDSTICLDVCGNFPNAPGCTANGDDQPVDGNAQGLLDTVLDRVLELLCEQIPDSMFCSEDKYGAKIRLEKSLLEKLLELYCRQNLDRTICLDACESFHNIPGCVDDGNGGQIGESRPIFNFQNRLPGVLGYDGVDEDTEGDGHQEYQDEVSVEDEARPIFNFQSNLPDVLGFDGVDEEAEDVGREDEPQPIFYLPGDGTDFSDYDNANGNANEDTEAVCSCLCTSRFVPGGGVFLVEEKVRSISQPLCVDPDTANLMIQSPHSAFKCVDGDACPSG